MSELYQVSGTVCEKPELCECGQSAVNFESIISAIPENNRIKGRCGQCQELHDAREKWERENPVLADDRFHLSWECDLVGDFSAVEKFDKEHGYPQ